MRIVELTDSEVLHYCTKEEGHFFDRKAYGVQGAKVQKIAVAFANSDGGEFVIGIDDEKTTEPPLKRWNGPDSTESFNSAIQALSELIPSVDFRFDFIKRKNVPRNFVLRVIVNKGLQVHKTASGDIYTRKGPQSIPIKAPVKILELTHAKGITSEEDSLVPAATIDEIEASQSLETFLQQLPIVEPDPLSFILQENLVDATTWTPRVASVLLFHHNPSAILPKQCAMRIVRYDTRLDDIDRDSLTDDNYLIEGPLYEQIENAFKTLNNVIAKNKAWTLDGLKYTRYPEEALWEVLVNAAIHRDYSISDNVLISVFRNRIEFKSPGRLPGFVTTENILDNRFSRNSKLVRLLSKYQYAPNKELGEGMNTAFQKMKDAGLKDPEVKEEDNYVKVIFRHSPIEDPESLIIKFLQKNNEINNRQAADLLGVDSSEKITALFTKMREKGSIKRMESTSGIKSLWTLL